MIETQGKSTDKYWRWIPLFIILLLAGIVYFSGSNQSIFFWLNSLSQHTGDSLWAYLTIFGDGLVASVLLLPLIRRRSHIVWTMIISIILRVIGVQCLLWIVPSIFLGFGMLTKAI